MIYCIGHRKPDIDTIVSSKILSEILKFNGIDCHYAVIEGEKIDAYNMKMINACMEYNPTIIKEDEIKNHKYYLLDHNNPIQSVKDENLVIACFDHHQNSNKIKNIHISNYCSTSLYIYELFKEKYPFTEKQKYQIYMATLNDSTFTKSSRFKEIDKIKLEELGFSKDYKKLFKEYFIPTDLSENKSQVFLNNGHKEYNFDDLYFESSYIETFGIKYLEEYKQFIYNYDNNFLGIYIDYDSDITYTYFKYNGVVSEMIYNFIASRATTIIDDILKKIS